MTQAATTPHTDPTFPLFPQGAMVTLGVKLHPHAPMAAPFTLSLLLPDTEWRKLVADFGAMPADERQRVGANIRAAVTNNPFPADGGTVPPRLQKTCDDFVNDCVLLAALAESVGPRVLAETAVESYTLLHGNQIRATMN